MMRKILFVIIVLSTTMFLVYCNPSKKAAGGGEMAIKEVPKSTYESGVATLVAGNCSPCHIAGKGRMKPYDNYANMKSDIEEIIRRIGLNPGEKGFMPFKKTEKLSDSAVGVFKKWKADGLLEK